MAAKTQKTTSTLGRDAAAAGRINRRTLAWASLALGAIILLAVNLIASSALREARLDLTKDRLFTISDGTRKALRAIDEPIDIRVYFSKKLGEAAPTYAKSFERVRTLLEQYRDIARGKVRVVFLDPEPFSDAEDTAVAAGLKGCSSIRKARWATSASWAPTPPIPSRICRSWRSIASASWNTT
jgi:ABC-type uncharacterized transport system involved in gliding motility auxiliary subunit